MLHLGSLLWRKTRAWQEVPHEPLCAQGSHCSVISWCCAVICSFQPASPSPSACSLWAASEEPHSLCQCPVQEHAVEQAEGLVIELPDVGGFHGRGKLLSVWAVPAQSSVPLYGCSGWAFPACNASSWTHFTGTWNSTGEDKIVLWSTWQKLYLLAIDKLTKSSSSRRKIDMWFLISIPAV